MDMIFFIAVIHMEWNNDMFNYRIRGVTFGGIGLIREVASLEDSIVPVVHLKSVLIRGVTFGEIGLIRGVTSLEDNLVVFYHLVRNTHGME
jgi:hypothetical protein